jgi:hypothetical protein
MARTKLDHEDLEALMEQDLAPYHPVGEKLDSWGCSSKERTLFSANKRDRSRIRKDVRRRIESYTFASA